MSEEIVNRVAKSPLVVFDLEEFYPEGERVVLDLADWLHEGLILREKDFRQAVKDHDWSQYSDAYVALNVSTDAIIPVWAYMLITSQLQPYANRVVRGDLETLESAIYQSVLENIDTAPYRDKPLIIKGCANKPVPPNAYVQALEKLRPVARSIQYGEACSSVPLFKRK